MSSLAGLSGIFLVAIYLLFGKWRMENAIFWNADNTDITDVSDFFDGFVETFHATSLHSEAVIRSTFSVFRRIGLARWVRARG